MSNYVTRFSKKRETRGRKEYDLVEKFVEGAAELVLLRAANHVRLARIRALKERLAKLPPVEGEQAEQFHQLEERIRIANLVTVDEILSEFAALAAKEVRKRAAKQKRNNVWKHTRVCSWESSQPPKLADGVQILALVLAESRWCNGPHRTFLKFESWFDSRSGY